MRCLVGFRLGAEQLCQLADHRREIGGRACAGNAKPLLADERAAPRRRDVRAIEVFHRPVVICPHRRHLARDVLGARASVGIAGCEWRGQRGVRFHEITPRQGTFGDREIDALPSRRVPHGRARLRKRLGGVAARARPS